MSDCVLKKVVNGNKKFLVKAVFKEASIKLTVLEDSLAFTAFVNENEIENFAKHHDLSTEIFYNKLREYLTGEHQNIKINFNNRKLTIQKIGELTVNFFKTDLHQSTSYVETVEDFLLKLYNENVLKTKKLVELETECTKLIYIKDDYEKQFDKLIEKKKSDDEKLYGRFLLILNEKKKRIQHLSELLKAFKAGRPTENPPVLNKGKKKNSSIKKIQSSRALSLSPSSSPSPVPSLNSDSNEQYYKTDDEEKNEPQPSTSTSFLNVLNDDEDDDDIQLPKRLKMTNEVKLERLPSTSHTTLENDENKNSGDEHNDNTPTINIDTQELLDGL